MKASELKHFLSQLPENADPDIVTGEIWLPERLLEATFDGEMVNLSFDNAPEETEGDEEPRGFLDHEVSMLKERIEELMSESSDHKTKAEVFLRLFIMGHEKSSSEVIEILDDPESWYS
ncbi:hypothetical protein DI392_00280 [Vibrio albus]|jgi:hypothetical protein|uniref:Uncharacterized protein n=1 Tax=Vibrio albus TaxID=2200953 RepID=A0A2U3BD88_9VIBR|nr:hypothetical protein [Vibrio albus]PWI34756.1 hypothetical protein DI392_00280 [Vibrio albus]